MHLLKVLCICFVVLMFFNNVSAWRRRRRRRRCDSTPCQWAWRGCSHTCGGGNQSAYITRNKGQCGACSMPSGTRVCNNQCCPVNCVWGGWGSWGGCSEQCGGGTRSRSRGYSRSARCGGSGCSGSSTSSERCNTQCCPVNCAWGTWGSYGKCSLNCGGGTQSRSRSVTRSTSCGGTCSGSSTSSRTCNSHPCPINCQWGAWSKFGSCPLACGGGTQIRTRTVSVRAQHGGTACSGSSSSSQSCNTHPCPINCVWGPWSKFGSCPLPCGGGTQSRTRSVAIRAQHGGNDCSGPSSSSQSCNTHPCPINCVWGAWSKFGSCPLPCGGGTQSRTRSVAIRAQHGGNDCSGPSSSSQTCNTHPCPINCVLGPWTRFSDCPVTCGGGTQSRTRAVAIPAQFGGILCPGSLSSSQSCNTDPCPVDCLWGEWGEWGVCSEICGGGRQSRTRKITQVALHGGQNCTGDAESTQNCNTQCCPVDCVWGQWSEFNACNATCGGGFQSRERQVKVQAICEGTPCSGLASEVEKCNTECCPVDCEWGPWGDFTPCPFACGGGTQFRSRDVAVKGRCGGSECPGDKTSSQLCNTQCCPVDCEWGPWSDYSDCSLTCGDGEKTRHRLISVNSSCSGNECSGPKLETLECNITPCPIHCAHGTWSGWSECNVTCGGGTKERSRIIEVDAKFGGQECEGKTIEKEQCNTQCCPEDCTWAEWNEWSSCSETCGEGSQMRGRTYEQFESCGGSPCDGEFTEERSCNDGCCPVDCVWGPWGEWGDCSRTCNSGWQERIRIAEKQNMCGGLNCSGSASQNRTCNSDCCPVDCVVTEWSSWSGCPDNCAVENVSSRNRSVVTRTECGGGECPALEEANQCDFVCHNGANKTSAKCICAPGWTGLCCETDLDECLQQGNNVCHSKAICVNTEGSYSCDCESGFIKNADSACVNINECSTSGHDCHASASCVDNDGSYVCSCKPGHTGDGKECTEINECESEEAICPANSDCINTEGSYRCECSVGFVSRNAVCVDIDECNLGTAVCDSNADCENTAGSYECYCHEGLSGDGKSCMGVDECTEFGEDICHPNGICTDEFIGYQCKCKTGFTGDGYTQCSDINECNQPDPTCTAPHMSCSNTEGSYQCTCDKFMALREGRCVELPPDFDLRVGGKLNEEPTKREDNKTHIQKLVLYGVSGTAVVLIVGLIVLTVLKRRRNLESNSLVNPNYDGNDGHSVDNDGFVAETINDGDL